MRQIEDVENLKRLPPHLLAAVLIAIRCGLRVSSILNLPFDCLGRDPAGGATLRYRNVKRSDSRERIVPLVHDDVVAAIEAQQRIVVSRFSKPLLLLPRENANPDGTRCMSSNGLTFSLKRWVEECDIADPQTAELAKFSFHQFRHTFATRLIAAGASEYFVSVLLDHESTTTTRGYAMLADPQRREEFDRFSKVNNRGEVIDGWDTENDWIRNGLARAQATLPNGYCSLPTQMECDARNACLHCDAYFVTSSEFLPVHRQQLAETRKLIAVAEGSGQFRMIENNRQVEETLERIITGIESDTADAAQR